MPTQQQRIDINCWLAPGHCSETAAAAGKHSAEVCKKSEPRVQHSSVEVDSLAGRGDMLDTVLEHVARVTMDEEGEEVG